MAAGLLGEKCVVGLRPDLSVTGLTSRRGASIHSCSFPRVGLTYCCEGNKALTHKLIFSLKT